MRTHRDRFLATVSKDGALLVHGHAMQVPPEQRKISLAALGMDGLPGGAGVAGPGKGPWSCARPCGTRLDERGLDPSVIAANPDETRRAWPSCVYVTHASRAICKESRFLATSARFNGGLDRARSQLVLGLHQVIAHQHPLERRTGRLVSRAGQLEPQPARPPPMGPAQAADQHLQLVSERRWMATGSPRPVLKPREAIRSYSDEATGDPTGVRPHSARRPRPPTHPPALPSPPGTSARPRSAPAHTGSVKHPIRAWH